MNSATVRRLEKDGLIEPDPHAEEWLDRWQISRKGEALLRENKEYLEPAGRRTAMVEGAQLLAQLDILLSPQSGDSPAR